MLSFVRRISTAWAENLRLNRILHAHRTDGPVAGHATIFRLIYIRVTACRTDFAALFQPPPRVLHRVTHCLHIKAFSVPQISADCFGQLLISVGDPAARKIIRRHFYADAVADKNSYAMLAHLSGNCGQDDMRAVVELDFKKCVGLLVDYGALGGNQIISSQ